MDMIENKRHFIVLLLMAMLCCSNMFAQQKQKVTVKTEKATLKKVFKVIEQQTTYHFSYRDEIIDDKPDITLNMTGVAVGSVLDKAFKNRNLRYRVVSDKSIVVFDKDDEGSATAIGKKADKKKITGRVIDQNGEPIIGASIMVKGTGSGSATDIDGCFNILTDGKRVTLAVSYLGFVSQEVTADGSKELNIMLQPNEQLLEEVVVTG